MRRSKHGLSHYKLLTTSPGLLVPVSWFEALPGDTFRGRTSALIRVSPLARPLMHPVVVRFHWWFVPNRIIWPTANGTFEEFITGGPDGTGGSSTHPTETIDAGGIDEDDLGDYLGIKPGVGDLIVNQLPILAYEKIYNEFYRDQNLVTEVSSTSYDDTPFQIAWEKDYFTSARTSPQVGSEVTLPLGSRAPVKGIGQTTQLYASSSIAVHETDGTGTRTYTNAAIVDGGPNVYYEEDPDNSGFPNIYADLSNASGASIIDFREAMGLQRYAEARARWGSRYTEWLRYYGVRSADARLQRPEYLGGGKQTIAFSEVLQTGVDSTDAGVGQLAGHGIAAMRSNRWMRFIPEHGIIMCLMSVRPKAMYGDALHRGWSRTTKEDYYTPELERIGMQEVYRREIYAEADSGGTGGDTIFGYQDRYAEYKHLPSTIAGEFRSTLNDWHLARLLAAAPALNQTFIECTPSNRVYQDQSSDKLWCMVNHSVQARRRLRKGGQTGL